MESTVVFVESIESGTIFVRISPAGMLSVNVAAEIVEIINKHIAVRILISFIKWMFKSILNEDCYKLVYCFFTDIFGAFIVRQR